MTQARRILTRGGIAIAVAIALAFGLAACGGDSPEALVASAKRYLDRRDYNAAAIELKNALQKKPQDGEARYLLGTVLVELRDFQSAEKELRRAVEFGFAPDKSLPALADGDARARPGGQGRRRFRGEGSLPMQLHERSCRRRSPLRRSL